MRSLRLRVRFSGDFVAGLSSANGSALPVARLEPVLIGGLYPAHNEDRILIKLDQVPPYLVETLVAVEDREFFNHFGVSPKSIARAVWVNLTAGQVRQGGSTLTQQLVKNFYLTNERSLSRKATEAMMAVLLELHYHKQEILEAYLNEVFLGQDGRRAVHGFGLASQYFFGQPLAELKLPQVALLVGMVKGPTYYNPRRNPERALERRNLVLDLLAEQQVISVDEAAKAKQAPLGVTQRGSMADSSYPAFLDLVGQGDFEGALAEARRVLRPGGRLVVLEFALPARGVWRRLYSFYFFRILPRIGRLISGSSAYEYLPASVESFADPPRLRAMIEGQGFGGAEWRVLAGGAVALHRARAV